MPIRLLLLVVCLVSLLTHPAQAAELQGQVMIQQPDGLVPCQSDGSIVFRVRKAGEETEGVEGKVIAGRYAVDLPADCEILVLATRTDEGAGYPLDQGRWFAPPASGDLEVVVRIPRPFTLRVYGPDGRNELKDITVIRKLRKFARLELPGPLDRKTHLIYQTVDSPIAFPGEEPEYYTYYLVAPGHAWTRFSPDPFLGGVQTLQLPEGGVLKVTLAQEGAGRGQVFRIRNRNPLPDAHPLVHELKSYENEIEVVGLAVGQYHISSEDPIRPSNMPVYGEADVEIQSGQTTELVMELKDEPLFTPVPAGGTIEIPREWGSVQGMVFRMNRLDPYGRWGRSYEIPGSELQPVEGRENLYSWKIDEVAPGAYNMSLAHTSYSVYREIYGNGNLRLDFVLPKPRTVSIALKDDRTGELVFPESLTWSAVEPEALRKKITDTAPFLSERRRLIVSTQAPRYLLFGANAPLRVRLEDPAYDPAEWIVDLDGDGDLTWPVHRTTAIRITLLQGDETVQWSGDARILSEGDEGKVTGARNLGRCTQFNLSGPGRYTIRFPELRGFQPIPPQTVQVTDGQILDVHVPLAPKH
ncbi:MAG: hypothetical protein R3F33_00370 [Planctomycetota bacterium]